MAMQQQILERLGKLEKELNQMKERMVDADCIMTEDDYAALLDYRQEKAEGKLIPHEQLKKEIGL